MTEDTRELSPLSIRAAIEAARRCGWNEDDITLAGWITLLAGKRVQPSPAGAGEPERLAAALAEDAGFYRTVAPLLRLQGQSAWAERGEQFARDASEAAALLRQLADESRLADGEIRRLEQALAEKDAALGRVQALPVKWRSEAAAEQRVSFCADELAAALRGEEE